MKKVTLFCLPYAGGASTIYAPWKKYVSDFIEVFPIEISGHGTRISSELSECMEDVVNDVYSMIKNNLDNNPYAIFGHSLGSLIAYELIYKIMKNNHNTPIHVFFSGKRPPCLSENKGVHTLPEPEFKNKILSLNGTPKEVFQNNQLSEIFLPILRADFKIIETYKYIERKNKLNCNCTVFSGIEDAINSEELSLWRNYTNKNCTIHMLPGDHFFINSNARNLIGIVNEILAEYK